jgi:hypothetical protein
MVGSKWVNGYQVYYDDYEYRWVKAIGQSPRAWELRYGSDFTDGNEFAVNYVDVGAGDSAFTQAITAGDRALLTTAQNESDGGQFQLEGTPFQIASGKPFYFGAKLSISDATQSDLFIGLSEIDTTILNAHAVSIGNGVYFAKLDGVTTISANAEIATVVSTANVGTAMDTSKHTYEIYFDGTTMYFYFDDGLVLSLTSGWPTVVVSPTFAYGAGAAGADTALVEWMRCIQLP